MKNKLSIKILLVLIMIITQINCIQNSIKFTGGADLKLRDSLKADSEFVSLNCAVGKSDEILKKESKIRLEAYQNFINKNGISKIKMECKTSDGDPIYSYLRIINGKASMLIDISEDKHGNKEVSFHECSDLKIGKYIYD